ncbi:MAG: hypothetical protein BGO26_05105 [Actinobacteria bacterium 69-20]|nr:hypothetical protein [Actinomycetota bacterium]OJV25276.1 MAG: hypothetical protein BGO26_05105 [Actinobacteria bacterium 69-20]
MSITGSPMDGGERGRQDDGRATPAGQPPTDWDAQFTAIVSGITGSMRWEATAGDLDEHANADPPVPTADRGIPRAPDSIWSAAILDTADDRRARRELRRAERAAELAAFQQAQAEVEAARAADTEHFVPPPPPPLPRLRRRTVGALLLMILGLLLLVFPALLPAPFELIAVLGLVLLLGGAAILVAGMRRHHDGSDGAEV